MNIKDWVSKPKYGREGEGVLYSKDFYSYDSFIQKTDSQKAKWNNFEIQLTYCMILSTILLQEQVYGQHKSNTGVSNMKCFKSIDRIYIRFVTNYI